MQYRGRAALQRRVRPPQSNGLQPRWSHLPATINDLGHLPVTTAAAHLRTTRVTLSRVPNGKTGVSAAMAIRLAAALGTTPELWMNMRSQYDLWSPADSATGSMQICACCQLREMLGWAGLGWANTLSEVP